MKRVIAVAFSDTHGGHRLGLLNPETVLETEDEEGEVIPYQPGLYPAQEFLWETYTKHIGEITKLAGKDEIIVKVMGDIVQGNKYAHEWVSTRVSDQFDIATWNMKPWLQLPNVKTVRFAKGTAAHNFGEGSGEITVAKMLRAEYPKKNIRTIYHGLAKIAGVTFDFAHHGPGTGLRNWLKGNTARYYLRSLMEDEFDDGNAPPDVVLRGHFHEYISEVLTKFHRDKYYTSRMVILPSYCMLDDYARQATKSASKVRFGMVAFEIVDGKILDVIPLIERVDLRTRENLA
jgi:hypothetical protein